MLSNDGNDDQPPACNLTNPWLETLNMDNNGAAICRVILPKNRDSTTSKPPFQTIPRNTIFCLITGKVIMLMDEH
jgi:hypothetical protein